MVEVGNKETINVRLRDVTDSDLPIFFEHQMDADATRMAAFPSRERDSFIAHWAKIMGDETVVKKTILCNERVAGNIVSWEQSGERDVGYWVGREYWGKGVATKALSDFLNHVKTRPLYAHAAKHNLASIRVLEKCGFTISGYDKVVVNARGDEVEEVIMKLARTPVPYSGHESIKRVNFVSREPFQPWQRSPL